MPKSCWCVGAVPQNNTVSRGDFRAQSHSRLNDGISSTQNIWVLPWTRFIYVLDAVSSYKCENHFSHSSVHLSSLSEKSSPFPCFAYSMQVLRHAGLPFVMSQRTKIWKSPKILNIYFNDHFICFDTFWTLFVFFNSNKVFYLDVIMLPSLLPIQEMMWVTPHHLRNGIRWLFNVFKLTLVWVETWRSEH